MENDLAIEPAPPSDPDAEALMAMLDAEVAALYDGTTGTGALSPEERAAFNGVFLIARRKGAPVACGAVRFLDQATGELKRIYVKAEERGSGAAQALVAELERAAEERGASRVVLETGDRMSRAIRFYEGLGYVRVPPYAEHAAKPWTVCFEKRLSDAAGKPAYDGVTFEPASPDHPDAARLIAAMTAEVAAIYSPEQIEAVREREALRDSPMELLLVRRGGLPVGCGGVQRLDDSAAELKRMYLVPEERGGGIAPELARRAESLAAERGFERIVLNTGARLERAVRLYERLGYVRVPPLPGWEDLEFLIWYGKPLA